MNEEKFKKKIESKYGVKSNEFGDLSLSKIKELKFHKNVDKILNDKFKCVKKPVSVLVKGGSLGAGVAGAVNTVFPNIVPVIGSAFTQAQDLSWYEKALGYVSFSSQPVDVISGPVIVGIGAAVGAVLYGGYSLIKTSVDTLEIVNDRKKAKRLLKK